MAREGSRLEVNARQFQKGLMDSLRRVEDHSVIAFNAIALHILRGVINSSPVDTGRFRNNWQLSIGRRSTIESNAGSGHAAYARGAANVRWRKAGQDAWITDNVPYAKALEHGHSGQAPHGVLGPTLARIRMASGGA